MAVQVVSTAGTAAPGTQRMSSVHALPEANQSAIDGHRDVPAPTSSQLFAGTVSRLDHFVGKALRIDAALEEKRQAVADAIFCSRLEADDTHASFAAVCDALVAEIQSLGDAARLEDSQLVSRFCTVEKIPHELLVDAKRRNSLIRFIQSSPKRRTKRIMQDVLQGINESPAMCSALDRAAKEREALIADHCYALAMSDHVPICVTLYATAPSNDAPHEDTPSAVEASTAVGAAHEPSQQLFSVCSLNVMERMRDGVNTYVCSLPCARTQAAREVLTSALCHPLSRAAQLRLLLQFLEQQLGSTSPAGRAHDAVCMQELDDEMLCGLRAESARRGWHMLASSETQATEGAEKTRCDGRTAIISPIPFISEPDVEVSFNWSATRTRSRRFAAATFDLNSARRHRAGLPCAAAAQPAPLTLVCVHVMHAPLSRSKAKAGSSGGFCSESSQFVLATLEAARTRFEHAADASRRVLAVGDFNCPVADLLHATTRLNASAALVDDQCDACAQGAVLDATPGLPHVATRPETPQAATRPDAPHSTVSPHPPPVQNAQDKALRALQTELEAWCPFFPSSPTQFGTSRAIDGACLLRDRHLLPSKRASEATRTPTRTGSHPCWLQVSTQLVKFA